MKTLSRFDQVRWLSGVILAVFLSSGPDLSAAQLWEKLLADFEIKVLPVATNIDHSVDYLRLQNPRPLRYRAALTVSNEDARKLLPPLIVDDPDTGRTNVAAQSSAYRPNAGKNEGTPASDSNDANPSPQPPALRLKAVAKPPRVVKPVAIVETTPDKVTFVESPPPARQLIEEERRRRELATQLRSLVPYFMNPGATNSGTVIGVGGTNNIVPFAPPQIGP